MKNFLNLSPLQKREIRRIEYDSMRNLALRLGWHPKDLQDHILAQNHEYLKRQINHFKNLEKDRARQKTSIELEAYLKESDIWSLLEKFNTNYEEMKISEVIKFSASLPINWTYLKRLVRDLQVTTQSIDSLSQKELLAGCLNNAPRILLFENEFNAFVSGRSMINNVPCVCIFHQLMSTLQVFSEVICPLIVYQYKDNMFKRLPLEKTKLLAQKSQNIILIKECLESLFSEIVGVRLRDKCEFLETGHGNFFQLLVTFTANDFIFFHELGHLLMGHLDIGPCHEVEFEADLFSAHLFTCCYYDAGVNYISFVGFVLVFVLMHVLELRNSASSSETHPSALLRYKAILRHVDSEKTEFVQSIFEAIAATLNPALMQYWDIKCEAPKL